MKRIARLGMWTGLVVMTAVNGWSATPWLDGYAYRCKLIVTNLAAVGSDQTNFPILVKLTSTNFNFSLANTNGYDLRFTAANGLTLLSYERERHDAAVGAAEYWVRLPSLSAATSTEFYVYYTPDTKSDGADPTNVWDANYVFVHHLKEAGGSSYTYDSTANAMTGTPTSVTLGANGYIYRAAEFDGSGSKYLTINNFTRPSDSTVEMWFKPDVFAGGWLYDSAKIGWYDAYLIRMNATGRMDSYLQVGVTYTGSVTLVTGTWHYVADIYGSQGRKLYVDGALDGSNPSTVIPPDCTIARFGQFYDGTLDELRVSKTVRSAPWIAAQNASMRDQLLSYGAEEAHVMWLPGYVYRRQLVVTNMVSITGSQTNFPILVRFTSTNFNFSMANTNGYDLRFTAADGLTLLSYERERHDAAARIAEYWVKLPGLSSAAAYPTVFYVYYTAVAKADGADPTNVWDANYVFVHHLKEAGGSSYTYDSTANAMTGTPTSVTLGAAGYIYRAAEFDGSGSKYLTMNNFTRPSDSTVEMWFKPDVFAGGWLYDSAKIGAYDAYLVRMNATGRMESYLQVGVTYTGSVTLVTGTWHYVADIYGSQGRKLYVDGALDGSNPSTVIPPDCTIARCGQFYDGTLDELRVSKTVRSAQWIAVQNASMRDQLLSYGAEANNLPVGSILMFR